MAVLYCQKKCSPSFFDPEDFRCDHEVVNATDTMWFARCESCGHQDWHYIPENGKKAYLSKWPQWNWSLGRQVESKDHMKAVAKKMGRTPVE